MDITKRNLLKAGASLPILSACTSLKDHDISAPLSADEILDLTAIPSIPKRDFYVEIFGAIGDGVFDCTLSIKRCIEACHAAGGGRVVFGKGIYYTGPIHLKSRVELHVPKGCELRFSVTPSDYLPAVFTRWEGMEMMGLSPLIYAYGETNVAISGGGVLNGQANNVTWWPWKGPHKEAHWTLIEGQDQKAARQQLFAMAEAGIPPRERYFAENSYLRPVFVQFYNCRNVLVQGVTIKNAPFWLLHPVLCSDVTVQGVTFSSHGPNSDGCDPESCKRVVIRDCFFDTGDDCIAIKSGRNADGRRLAVPSQDILVQDCQMRAGHGGVVIGSEISGGMNNLHVRRCEMSSPELERAIRIKTNASRGGVLRNLYYSDIKIGFVKDVFVVNYFYEEGEVGQWMPLVDNVNIKNVTVDRAERIFMLRGFDDDPIQSINIENLLVNKADDLGVIENIVGLSVVNSKSNGMPIKI
jgi:polygalacturonase